MSHDKTAQIQVGRIRVGRIHYVNVDPIYHGLENGLAPEWMQIKPAAPSSLNRMMAESKLDLSPVSTGAYARHTDQWLILPDLSISCHGSVMSVLLASRYPLDDLEGRRVLITPESGTAVLLLKLIFAIKGIHPLMTTGAVDERATPDEKPDAVMVIGDNALSGKWNKQYPYLMDLGQEWLALSGLPIVFAVWTVRKSFADSHTAQIAQVIELFRQSREMGHANLGKIITDSTRKLNLPAKQMAAYFHAMEYDLGEDKRRALKTFFDELHAHGLIGQAAPLSFFS